MRWTAFLLLLLNVVVFLVAHRLPETAPVEPAPANLPRVSTIELLNEADAHSQRAPADAGEHCRALTGFLSREGARDWARVHSVAPDGYRVEPAGVQQRAVFRVVSGESGSRSSLRPMLRAALERRLDAYFIEDAAGVRVQAGLSQSLSEAKAIQQQTGPQAGEFALERDRQHLYSFALVAEGEDLTRLLEQKNVGKSTKLEVVRCEAIAKPR